MDKKVFASVDEYIESHSGKHKSKLMEMRSILKEVLPDAQEVISYGMPAYKQIKIIVYYAANKNHIGLYPHGSGVQFYLTQNQSYKSSKGAIQFPLDQDLPKVLIQDIALFRLEEELSKKK